MAAHRIVDGVYIRLPTPGGFVDAARVFPSFLEIYRRDQEVLAVYLEDCRLRLDCRRELPDPFVEVLVPEKMSPLRRMEHNFFEDCKLEVEAGIRRGAVRPEEAEVKAGRPLPPLAIFTDGPGWFSCCTLRYTRECPPMRPWKELIPANGKSRRTEEGGASPRGFPPLLPCLTGNIVFTVRDLPVIVNLHRSVDPKSPLESFAWMRQATDSYRRLILPLNGVTIGKSHTGSAPA
ncbi:MAG: hypothetical protein J1E80_08130 [Desulfovibrionaceae bacterium]|nr:hypothetical protein [Desulfovibrionaceae bacterium]